MQCILIVLIIVFIHLNCMKTDDFQFPRFETLLFQPTDNPDLTFDNIQEKTGYVYIGEGTQTLVIAKFKAFRTSFHLILVKQNSFLSSGVIDSKSTVTIFGKNSSHFKTTRLTDIDTNYYVGREKGFVDSRVEGYMRNKIFNGVIKLRDETYFVELSEANSRTQNAIIYKQDDALRSICKNRDPVFCFMSGVRVQKGLKPLSRKLRIRRFGKTADVDSQGNTIVKDGIQWINYKTDENSSTLIQRRRVCSLLVTIDISFLDHYRKSETLALEQAMYPIILTNAIFLAQDFNGDGKPDLIGFRVGKIIIYNHNHFAYAENKQFIDAEELIKAVSLDTEHNRYCLSVLFVSKQLHPFGTIGLSYMGNVNDYERDGGICTPVRQYSELGRARLNTVVITNMYVGRTLPHAVFAIVLSHQFGHSFGSPHDQDITGDCESKDYIMRNIARTNFLQGTQLTFSRCSLDKMNPVIHRKGWCLHQELYRPVCGNGVTEIDEECDCGRERENCHFIDPCCIPADLPSGCRVNRKEGFECSSSSSQCCKPDCKLARRDDKVTCRSGHPDCGYTAYCSGNETCDNSGQVAPHGKPCEKGTKMCDGKGYCNQTKCSTVHSKECECDTPIVSRCRLCCLINDTCQPLELEDTTEEKPLFKPPDSPCNRGRGICNVRGFCQEGLAGEKTITDKTLIGYGTFNLESERRSLIDYWFLGLMIIIVTIIVIWVIYGVIRIRRKILELKGFTMATKVALEMLKDSSDFHLMPEYLIHTGSRIVALFPQVPIDVVAKVVQKKDCELEMVATLLRKGYPMRIDFREAICKPSASPPLPEL